MNRARRRISRGLIGLLVVTVAVGLIFYFHNTSPSKAIEATNTPSPQVTIAPPPTIFNPDPAPATQPTTEPSTFVANLAPSTQPAPHAAAVFDREAQTRTERSAAAGPALSGDPIADAKSKVASDDFLTARKILNDALLSGHLSDPDTATAKQLLGQINQAIVFSPKRFADDEFGGTYSVQTGEIMRNIAKAHGVTPELLCQINGLSDPRRLRAGATLKVLKGPFNALVDKKKFTLEIWLGDPYSAGSYYIKSYGVGLGRDDSTPSGKWLVEPQKKLKNPTYYSPRGEGVIPAGDPKNPLGEYWIGLSGLDGHAVGKQSYGIHGTIDPDSIGKQSSMGCIRMHNEDAAEVFSLLVEGKSTVTVRD